MPGSLQGPFFDRMIEMMGPQFNFGTQSGPMTQMEIPPGLLEILMRLQGQGQMMTPEQLAPDPMKQLELLRQELKSWGIQAP